MTIWKTHSTSSPEASRRWFLFAPALMAMLLVSAGAATAADADDARSFVERLGSETVEILSDQSASDDQRLARLSEVLTEATDFSLISRLVMGQHWRAASEAQRNEISGLLENLVISAMSQRLDSYEGQTFEVTGVNALDERDTMVATLISGPTLKQPFKVEWRVRNRDGSFALIDIVGEGISMIVTQRSEVSEVINRSGIDGLIAEIKARIANGGTSPS